MVRKLLFVFLCVCSSALHASDSVSIYSPNGRIRVQVESGKELNFSISFDNRPLIFPSEIGLQPDVNTGVSRGMSFNKTTQEKIRSEIISPFPEKRARIPDNYNELTIRFNQPTGLIFRVYDDGVAYRWVSFFQDSIIIKNEIAVFRFPPSSTGYFPEITKRDNADIFHTSFEELYRYKPLDSLRAGSVSFSPVLVLTEGGPKVVITESDLEDYPGMFISGTNSTTLSGIFPGVPAEERVADGEYPQVIVTRRKDYIARTAGSRKFPWRVFLIAEKDRELPANDLVYRLASPSRLPDISWIHPGKGTDEWIVSENLFNVPFKSGINTATYKYYIDFAKKFGFDRIMLDAGWSDTRDLFKINPAINMDTLAAYAREKHIKLSMWTLAMTLDKQLEPALAQFNKWRVDFIMTDFMDRNDQEMVRFYFRMAEACARHHLMIMFHGAFPPAGFGRTYPNAITRESVLGSEYNIWSDKPTPDHNLLLPYIRMTAGPMDYEPGLLNNATKSGFRPVQENVMSSGTRTHQAAMFVVYESPIQIFSGNPSQGLKEPEFMKFLGSLPTVWDTTIVMDGKIGEYIVTARKKGADWYIGAMTNWTARELEMDLSFLGPADYRATLCEDGVNADRYASDYTLTQKNLKRGERLRIRMAPGGGFVCRLAAQIKRAAP